MSETAPGPSQAPPQEVSVAQGVSTPRAEHVYGQELHDLQQSNKEFFGIDETAHKVWEKGKTLTLFLRDAEEWNHRSQPGGEYEDNNFAKGMAESMQNNANRVREQIRQQFLEQGHAPEDLTDDKIDFYVKHRVANFEETIQEQSEMLDQGKEVFILIIQDAIEHQGLPISKQQLHDRLKGLTLSTTDPLNYSEGFGGVYNPLNHHVELNSHLGANDNRHVLMHELVHAISGKRIIANPSSTLGSKVRTFGLEEPTSKLWLNEGITDMLAYVLWEESGQKLDFGSTNKPLIDVTTEKGQLLLANMQEFLKSEAHSTDGYNHYNTVAIKMLTQIPAYTLMRAVLAQNNDPHEADQMAGTHAERDLQRALKVAGGVEMLKKMRIVEQAFKEKNYDLANAVADDVVANPPGPVQRFKNKRSVAAHTKKYQAQIQRAKKAASV